MKGVHLQDCHVYRSRNANNIMDDFSTFERIGIIQKDFPKLDLGF